MRDGAVVLRPAEQLRLAGVRRQDRADAARRIPASKRVSKVSANTIEEFAHKLEGVNAEAFPR